MLTNFFGKSKPINFIVCGLYLLLVLLGALWGQPPEAMIASQWLGKLGVLLLLFFSVLLLDFVIRKNALTQTNTYGIFLFVCFVGPLAIIFFEKDIVISNVFLLLAIRRIASVTSERNIEKKLFDTSLYITIAAIFHFWSILFLLPLYWGITKVSTRSFRLFFIPFVGVFTAAILMTTYLLMRYDTLHWFYDWVPPLSFNFSVYNTLELLIPLAVMAAVLIWVFVDRILKAGAVPKKLQANHTLVSLILLVSLIVCIVSPVKSGAELLFVLAPLAIVTTNYIEKATDFWFKEALLWTFMILPFVLFFFYKI